MDLLHGDEEAFCGGRVYLNKGTIVDPAIVMGPCNDSAAS